MAITREHSALKTFSDLENSNAHSKVCCTYLWRHCDVFLWEKPVFHFAIKFVAFILKNVEQKRSMLEIKFLYKKCQSWPYLCENNWDNYTFFPVWWNCAKPKMLGLLLPSLGLLRINCTHSTHTKYLKNAEQVFLGILQHPTTFQVKILRGTKLMEILSIINPTCNSAMCLINGKLTTTSLKVNI